MIYCFPYVAFVASICDEQNQEWKTIFSGEKAQTGISFSETMSLCYHSSVAGNKSFDVVSLNIISQMRETSTKT